MTESRQPGGTWQMVVCLAVAATVMAGAQTPAPPPAQPPPGRGPQTPPAQAAAAPTQANIDRANALLAEARKAMGGEKLAAVKSLIVTGRTKRVRGNNLVPIEFEMSIELPDKYVRKDESPAEETDPTSTGFNGDALIQIPPPVAAPPRAGGAAPGGAAGGGPAPASGAAPAGAGRGAAAPPDAAAAGRGGAPGAAAGPGAPAGAGPGGAGPGRAAGPPPDPRRARVIAAKQDFARLTLGLFAQSFPSYPLTFAFAAQAESPQGKADVIDVKGEGNFTVRLLINSETHLPVMVSWQQPPSNVIVLAQGQPQPQTVAPGAVIVNAPALPAASATQEEKDKYAKDVAALRAKAQSTSVERRLYFADYRPDGGVTWPYRLRRAIGADTTEETTFDRFRLNAKIDPRKFEAVK